MGKLGQMKIQQMAIMIIAVFIFFVIAGLFVINIQLRSIEASAEKAFQEEAEATLDLISSMTEFNYVHGGQCANCLDSDKLRVMTQHGNYSKIWPITFIKVYLIHPPFTKEVKCPAIGCNYYGIIGNPQNDTRELSTFVNVCEKKMENYKVYDDCELAKISIGVKNPGN